MAKRSSTQFESEHHIVGVRMRVVGVGNLDMALSDLDNIQTQVLQPFPLQATTRIEPTRLANFQSQRTRLTVSTNVISESFLIQRIIIFAKPVAVEYPM